MTPLVDEVDNNVLILGASTRVAAQSARRAGYSVFALDRFADADLQACCVESARVDRYPDGFPEGARAMPRGPWLYTGALENYPALIAQVASERLLLGAGAEVVRLVRDHVALSEMLRAAGFAAPETVNSARGLPRDGTWLRKAIRSAGGLRVEIWNESSSDESGEPAYWQARVAGDPQGAVFLAARGRAVLLGVTRSLMGPVWGAARTFQYAGSIGPLSLSDVQRARWQSTGQAIAHWSDLSGLFGVDAVVNDDGIWPVEVNPRFTASVELLDRAGLNSTVAAHVAACQSGTLADCVEELNGVHGKQIVYAPRSVTVPEGFATHCLKQVDKQSWPTIADIPCDGTHIAEGHPIATVFAGGETMGQVEVALRTAAARLQSKLFGRSAPA